MKFKAIFVLFNVIVIISFLFITLLPLFMLGFEYAAGFWSQTWYVFVVFIAILGSLDGYFLVNWRFFTLLELQDWDGVKSLIEDKVANGKRVTQQSLAILLNIYVQRGQVDSIVRLADDLRTRQPRLFQNMIVSFGIGWVLQDDYAGLVEFLDPVAAQPDSSTDFWAHWYWAFAQLRLGNQDAGVRRLEFVADRAKDQLLRILTLYMLIAIVGDSQTEERHAKFLTRWKLRNTQQSWEKTIAAQKDRIYVIAMSAVLQQAGQWFLERRESEG